MTILCLETSTKVCSVGLGKKGVLLQIQESNESNYSHSENLTVYIEQICDKVNVYLKEIDAVAVSKGPGSYTGLRIGVSAAKGLCYALNKPLIAINSLEAMALRVKMQTENKKELNRFFCPMLDARRMEVYCALYDSQLKEVIPTCAKIIDETTVETVFMPYLENKKSIIYFFGEGAEKCKAYLNHPQIDFIDNIQDSSQYMLPLAEKKFIENKFEDVAYFEPFYLKDFVSTKHASNTNVTL